MSESQGESATGAEKALREQVDRAVGGVLWNAMNYPKPEAVLGMDISSLRNKVVDAVVSALVTDHTKMSVEIKELHTQLDQSHADVDCIHRSF